MVNLAKICPVCSIQFVTDRETKIYCSKKCWQNFYKVVKNRSRRQAYTSRSVRIFCCEWCEKTVTYRSISGSTKRFCSRLCQRRSYEERRGNGYLREWHKKYRSSERYRQYHLNYQRKLRSELNTLYIKKILYQQTHHINVPTIEIIELKCEQLKLTRLINEKQRAINNPGINRLDKKRRARNE
jgi:hypothetical protein